MQDIPNINNAERAKRGNKGKRGSKKEEGNKKGKRGSKEKAAFTNIASVLLLKKPQRTIDNIL